MRMVHTFLMKVNDTLWCSYALIKLLSTEYKDTDLCCIGVVFLEQFANRTILIISSIRSTIVSVSMSSVESSIGSVIGSVIGSASDEDVLFKEPQTELIITRKHFELTEL